MDPQQTPTHPDPQSVPVDLVYRIANLTRLLRESMRDLGLEPGRLTNVAADKHFSDAASPQW